MLLAAVLIVVTTTAFGYQNGVADGRLVDTDAYSWVTRAAELHTTSVWLDDTLDGVYPPVGHKQHWSRPFDALVLAGGVVGAPFVGFAQALFGWAVVLPVILGVTVAWLLWWGFADVLGAAGRDAFALLFALQPMIIAGFMAGRADHQALIGVLLVATLAIARKALMPSASPRQIAIMGLLSALGLWVGMEFAILIAVVYACLAYDWVRMRDAAASQIVTFSTVVAAASMLALLAENGLGGIVRYELDELSIVWVAAIVSIALAAATLRAYAAPLTTPWRRAAALLVAVLVCSIALVGWVPDVLNGPLGATDPLYESTRLASIAELQPLLDRTVATWSKLALRLSLAPFAVYGVILWRRDRIAAEGWGPLRVLLIAAVVYGALSVAQIRWLFALSLVIVIPAALGVQALMHRAAPHATRVHLGMAGVAAVAALWWVPPTLLSSTTVTPTCDMNDAVTALNDTHRVGSGAQRTMAFTDFGPEILFRTPHQVFSIPNHRPQPGYTATYRIMRTTDRASARRQVERQHVDLLLICSDVRIRQLYRAGPNSFHTALASGDAPPWLTEVPMPEGQPRFRLYRVDV